MQHQNISWSRRTFWNPAIGPADRIISLLGRLLIAHFFIGASILHLVQWTPTIARMKRAGVIVPELSLIVAMGVSALSALALFLLIQPKWAARILAAYTLVVSWIMHNPMKGPPDLFFFLKDTGVAGALMIFSAVVASHALTIKGTLASSDLHAVPSR